MDVFRATGWASNPNIEAQATFCYGYCVLYLRKIELLFKENVYFKMLR